MPTKDRLAELQAIATSSDDSPEKGKKNEKSLRKSFQKCELVMKWIEAVQENTDTCEDILKRSGSDKDAYKKLESTFKNSETISHNISSSLKELNKELENSRNKSGAEYRMILLQYMSLKDRFKNALYRHQELVQWHRDMRKDFLRKCNQIRNQGEDVDDERLESMVDQQAQVFSDNYLITEQEARRMLEDVETRHKELLTIESHLTEVRDQFLQLAMLVELQQESINRVEYHAELATDYIENTVVDLQKAEKSKKKNKKMKIYLLITAIVIILLIIIGFLV